MKRLFFFLIFCCFMSNAYPQGNTELITFVLNKIVKGAGLLCQNHGVPLGTKIQVLIDTATGRGRIQNINYSNAIINAEYSPFYSSIAGNALVFQQVPTRPIIFNFNVQGQKTKSLRLYDSLLGLQQNQTTLDITFGRTGQCEMQGFTQRIVAPLSIAPLPRQ